MELADTRLIPAAPADVWHALNDVDVLRASIPGCDSLEPTGDNAYRAVVTARIGPISASFNGRLMMTDIEAPHAYTLRFDIGHHQAAVEARRDRPYARGDDGAVRVIAGWLERVAAGNRRAQHVHVVERVPYIGRRCGNETGVGEFHRYRAARERSRREAFMLPHATHRHCARWQFWASRRSAAGTGQRRAERGETRQVVHRTEIVDPWQHRPNARGARLEIGVAQQRVEPDDAPCRLRKTLHLERQTRARVGVEAVADQQHDCALPQEPPRPAPVELGEAFADPRAARPVADRGRHAGSDW